ncbi:hypothetical protein ACFQVA_16250 [Actinomadura keratinilytica]
MRVLVTVVGEGTQPHDVMVDAEESATAADVALALTGAEPFQKGAGGVVTALRAPPPAADTTSLWADGRLCDPAAPASAVLSDGMRVSTDDSVGPLLRRGEPVGWYEIRVAAGPPPGGSSGSARAPPTSAPAPTAPCRSPTRPSPPPRCASGSTYRAKRSSCPRPTPGSPCWSTARRPTARPPGRSGTPSGWATPSSSSTGPSPPTPTSPG